MSIMDAIAGDVSVNTVLNGVIQAGTVCLALGGIGAFLHFAVVRPFRKFLREEVSNHLVDIKKAVEHNIESTEDIGNKLNEHIANGGHSH